MSFDADNEILQDFLIEAGEILEDLSEQLVSLENEPTNMDLLNAIFRGFHTVKGGSGFLNLDALVEVCHITENIFDILRNGEREADAELMDCILQALDIVNDMFDSVRAGENPESAEPEFLAKLGTYAAPAGAPAPSEAPAAEENQSDESISDEEFDSIVSEPAATNEASSSEVASGDDITDDEFESLLDDIHGKGSFSADDKTNDTSSASTTDANQSSGDDDLFGFDEPAATNNNDITDEEFENLLDELHGKDGGGSQDDSKNAVVEKNSELINDDEFENLLDELHGAGKGPVSEQPKPKSSPKQENQPAAAPTPAAKPTEKTSAPSKGTSASQAKPEPAKPAVAKKPVTANVTEATVRVDTRRLDDIMNMVGELVLARNRLKTIGQSSQDESLTKAIANLDIVTGDLQGAVMKTRMQPIKKVFGRFPRVVRDLARSLKKEITLEMVGEDTDLDKNLVEALADPLVHLVRNSVDHGIELPEERVANDKPRNGTIVLSAAQEGDHILLSIEDDGKGMNADVLRGIAVAKGLMDKEQAERLTDTECYNLIFMAGFSTKQEISDISGRGVGMDVVKTKITQLNGSVSIDSTLGKGTKLSIKVPLTLAILPTLMVKVKEQSFALPLTSVNEIFHLDLTKTNKVDGQLVVVVREKPLPLFFLNEWLARNVSLGKRDSEGHVVLVQVGTQRVGFVVDSLIGRYGWSNYYK